MDLNELIPAPNSKKLAELSRKTFGYAVDLDNLNTRQRFALKNSFGKQKQRHVGSAPRPVDREEAQPCCRQIIEMGICVCHQLIGSFCSPVQADWVIHIVTR